MKAIFERHSYRGAYLQEAVPRGDLKRIMEAGLAAPSGCNKQNPALIAVDDPELLARIREIMQPPLAETAPALICVLTRRKIAYRDGFGRDRCFAVQDYSAAIENMLLEIVHLGYQSCWIEGHVTDADLQGERIAALLGVPKETHDLVCVLPIGKAAEPIKPVKKRAFEERAWFNGYEKE
ncbi:MAG: nitroreductase family protein [Oscillospiraceae bacterium]|nr:nitroreductase family protein [Oscillospiraceae bacterium]